MEKSCGKHLLQIYSVGGNSTRQNHEDIFFHKPQGKHLKNTFEATFYERHQTFIITLGIGPAYHEGIRLDLSNIIPNKLIEIC